MRIRATKLLLYNLTLYLKVVRFENVPLHYTTGIYLSKVQLAQTPFY